MKVGHITESQEVFSFKNQRFSDQRFILSIRDKRYEYNVVPIIYIENGKLIDLDEYEFGNNLFATRPPLNNPNNIEDLSLNRFHHNQLLKIDYGTIVDNYGAENPNMPKVKTFNANIHSLNQNQVIEFFEGELNEEDSLFKPISNEIFDIIKSVYIESENCFFVIKGNTFIGPFIASKVNENSFEITKSKWREFGEYLFSENSFIEFEANDFARKIYIPECKELNLTFKNNYEFISNDELLKQFELELKTHPTYFNESSLENIQNLLNKVAELKPLEKILSDNSRLKNLVEQSEKILITNTDLINFFPEVKKLKEDKERIDEQVFIANIELQDIITKRKELHEEIENLEQTKSEAIEKHRNLLNAEIKELETRKNNLNKEVEEEKLELENNLQDIRKNIEDQKVIEDYLKAGVKKLQEEFTSEQKDAQYKLAELVKGKTHFDFISGRDLSTNEDSLNDFQDFVIKDQFKANQYRDFRNEVLNILKQHNRNFDTHFIDNLLISIFQNTLTVFAGVPGTGKTTLARILTNILTPKEKIREVSVNRGWTSQKDFIGFVNPLTKKFHSSSTDIYSLMNQINFESNERDMYLNSPMSFIILDEANLSPLEHYWSSFYNLTDSTGMLVIKLGHKETIKFPNNLRFIGTINYDHTTEELSPRVLDRINIIQLNKNDDLGIIDISSSNIQNLRLSFQRCIDFFELHGSNNNEIKLDDRTNVSYKEVKNQFKNLKIFISPRVEIAIIRYISLANKYMSDVNKPLDYCIAQRLLPLINLQGSENKQKLEILKDKLKDIKCEMSVKILEDIISIGSEKGIYEDNFNYFLTLSNV